MGLQTVVMIGNDRLGDMGKDPAKLGQTIVDSILQAKQTYDYGGCLKIMPSVSNCYTHLYLCSGGSISKVNTYFEDDDVIRRNLQRSKEVLDTMIAIYNNEHPKNPIK